MNEQIEDDYPALSNLYAVREQGKDMRELLARTHTTLMRRVQDQLDGLKSRMLELDDPTSAEFKQVHMRARVLGALFAEIAVVIIEANAADVAMAERDASQTDNDQGGEL